MCVVYFNQQLGAAHPKRWLKYTFLTLLTTKSKKGQKSKKLAAKFSKKNCFFKFAPKRWSNVLFPKNRNLFNSLPCQDLNPGPAH